MKNIIIAIVVFISFASCSEEKKEKNKPETEIELKYASKFKLFQGKNYIRVQIFDQDKKIQDFKVSENPLHDNTIKIPFKTFASTSTTHIGYVNHLNMSEKLIAFPGTNLISDSLIHKRVLSGKVAELGTAENINIEELIKLNPDVLLDYPNPTASSKRNIILKSGIQIINITEFYEEKAMGKVEWIKLFGILFGSYKDAVQKFETIETNYNRLATEKHNQENKPTLFSGIVYGDSWYAPGGNSFTARFYKLAGGNYIWADNKNSGSILLPFEKVLNEAINADYWIGVGGAESLDKLSAMNSKYKLFKAFKNKNVYSVYGQKTSWGANPYFERGVIRPDLILEDYIKVLSGDDEGLNFLKKLE